MKRILIIVCIVISYAIHAQTPIIKHMYTADPSAHVFGDRLYVYPSHDEDTASWFNMKDWHVFSTDDLIHWTDHGKAFSLNDTKWAKKEAWAPNCKEMVSITSIIQPIKSILALQ